jgi:hypothetical protein
MFKKLVLVLSLTAAAAGSMSSADAAAVKPALVKPALFKPMPVKPVLVRSLRSRSLSVSPLKAARQSSSDLSLQTTYDDRSGHTLYRLGNKGMWME